MNRQTFVSVLQVQTATGGQDELPLGQPTVKVGRGKDNDLILNDPKVSGHHLQFSLGREGWWVEDLGSRNGTFLNGRQLVPQQPTLLSAGDVVRAGDFAFQMRAVRPDEGPLPSLSLPVHISAALRPGLVVYLPRQVLKFPLEKEVVTLGRKSDNDLQVVDPLVSGHHARLERFGASYRILDLGSTNGLVYQGQRITDRVLAPGDTLYIGQKIAIQYRAYIGFLPGEVVKKPETPKTQYLDMNALPKAGRRITIGRHSGNVLVLDHPRVSRYHAVIEQFGARFRLRDLNSDNGTFVNGKQVKEAWIKEGDEIRIASFRLIFREDGITHFDEAGNIRLDALHIEKWYSKTACMLKDVSLSFYPKEFVAIVGASGAGKSTLMNALNGFNPANGPKSRVLVNGKNLYTHMDEYRSEMGYVPQEDIIHRELSVYKALDYAAQLRMPADTSKQERQRRVMEVIEELGLKKQAQNSLNALSGGQRKRVSIGVELLTKPGLFFLDEATSGLDPGTETEMMELLRDLADGGRTVILVTHATKNVMMCDQVVFLAKGGYLAYFGPPNEALEYFEQYRTPEERRYKEEVEFDDIYQLLEKRGTPEEWGQRYRQSSQYQEYVVKRLCELKEQRQTPTPAPVARATRRRPVSAFRQFLILSSRNLAIMAQDKVGLGLMLAVAPFIGALDFIWGKKLFDLAEGDAGRIIMMFFMMGLIAILAGSLSSVREIVKEVDIYRRERTVVLKLLPYLLSKIWIGMSLAAYQAGVFLLTKKIFVDPQLLGPGGYPALYVTIFLCTLSGYMIGLAISAAAPNQNIALFLVLGVLVPQFLFAGALLPLDQFPGGEQISVIASSRWAFEASVRITGIGDDIINDPCWQLPKEQWDNLTQDDKDRLGCRCMGKQIFTDCYFPGIRNPEFYNPDAQAALGAPKPAEPPTFTPYPTLTPYPTFTPIPKPAGLFADMESYQNKLRQQGEQYEKLRQAQGQEYEEIRNAQGEEYRRVSLDYGEDLRKWEADREKAVRGAEGKIKAIYENFERAFRGTVQSRWLAMIGLAAIFFVLAVIFQKRKDVI